MSRPILATWYRRNKPVRTLSYARIDNALPRMTYHLMWGGEPGDTVELSHRDTGLYLGHVKVRVGGKIESEFLWDKE